jgi:S1-C subfamily serine protease
MPNGLVIHIVSGDDRHTELFSHERIRIGTAPDCDLRLRSSAMPPGHEQTDVVLELGRGANHYRIKGYDAALGLTQNGKPIELNARIQDGDEIRIDGSDLELQFFPVRALPAVINQRESLTAPFTDNQTLQTGDQPRRDDAKVFLRELTRELIREINPSTKIITLLIMGVLVGGILYLGFSFYREMRTLRRTSDSQTEESAKIAQALTDARKALEEEQKRNRELQGQFALTAKIFNDYSKGVCVVSGSYIFTDASTGRPRRYPSTTANDEGAGGDASAGGQLTPDGDGAVAEFEFIGTGFYVGNGYILTNRHVVQPWSVDANTSLLSSRVNSKPKLKTLVVYFPGMSKSVPISVKQTSTVQDLAACTFEGPDAPTDLPVLPLDEAPGSVAVGKEVAGMGYPNGTSRLLANLPEAEAQSIQERYGRSLLSLLAYLSSSNKISPFTTKGTITDLNPDRIVHSAFTAEGGSGAPLFGDTGQVIGVNFAIFPENNASNMAIPVRFALVLLKKAGWSPPDPTKAPEAPAKTAAAETAK